MAGHNSAKILLLEPDLYFTMIHPSVWSGVRRGWGEVVEVVGAGMRRMKNIFPNCLYTKYKMNSMI